MNDADTGFVYMQARYYDPVVGRFLSVDPVGPSTPNIFRFNRFAYANNNPLNAFDPDGKATVYNHPDEKQMVIVQTFKNEGVKVSDKQISEQGTHLSGRTSIGTMVRVVLKPGNDSYAAHIKPNSHLDDTITE